MKVTDLIYTIKVDPPAHLFTGRSTLDKFPAERIHGSRKTSVCNR